MHTGTHFITDLLRSHGAKTVSGHFHDVGYSFPVKGALTVCPIRKPESVYVSWFSRGNNLYFFKEHWELFNKFFLDNGCFLLPVDSADRGEYLDNLSEALDIKLSTDWKPIGSKLRKNCEIPDLSSIYELPVVGGVYGNS